MNKHEQTIRNYQKLDLHQTTIAAEFIYAYSNRLSSLLSTLASHQPPTAKDLVDLYTGLIQNPAQFNPVTEPSFNAWVYKTAINFLAGTKSIPKIINIRNELIRILHDKPHELSSVEIAAVLNLREHFVLARLSKHAPGKQEYTHNNPPDNHPQPDPDLIQRTVIKNILTKQNAPDAKTKNFTFPFQESIWVIAGLGIILIAAALFLQSSDAEMGQPLFPSPTPPLPQPLLISAPEIHIAPTADTPLNNNFFISTAPEISNSGRYITFMSSLPGLIERDTNEAFDVFVFDLLTNQIVRISETDQQDQLNGNSYLPKISADESTIAFIYAAPQGAVEILIRDWQNNSTENVLLSTEMGEISDIFSLSISGDGNTVAFLGAPSASSTEDHCANLEEGYVCADLYIWQRHTQILNTIPLDIYFLPWIDPPSMNFDGTMLALTITQRSRLWSKITSPNRTEAIIYDWKNDGITLLNTAPGGINGNGDSHWAAVSASGEQVLFISNASNLTQNDSNGQPDLFFIDLRENLISKLENENFKFNWHTPESGNLSQIEYGTKPYISTNGQYAIFNVSVPVHTINESIYCRDSSADPIACMGIFIFDAVSNTTKPLDISSVYKSGDIFSMIRFPSITNDGRQVSFMTDRWHPEIPCLEIFCSRIWSINLNSSQAAHITANYYDRNGAQTETGWSFAGNIPILSRWIKGLAVDPQGNWLAAGGQDGEMHLFAINRLESNYKSLKHPGEISTAAFSPDGKFLAVGTLDNAVLLWNAETGEQVFGLYDHPGFVQDVEFSPDGSILAVGSQHAVWLWQKTEEDFFFKNGFEQNNVRAISFSPDGKWLAAVSEEEVWVRRVADGEIIARLQGHMDSVLDAKFSPVINTQYLIATASKDNTVNIWEMSLSEASPKLTYRHTLKHNDWVYTIAFSPDGQTLAAGSFDSNIYLWDTSSGDHIANFQRSRQDQILSLMFSPRGDTIFSGTVRGLRTWKITSQLDQDTTPSRFFSRTNQPRVYVSSSYEENWFANMNTSISKFSRLRDAADFDLFKISSLEIPDNFTLETISIFLSEKGAPIGAAYTFLITSNFQPAHLTILETMQDIREVDWEISAHAEIRETQVKDFPAEYVVGGWNLPQNAGGGRTLQNWNDEAASLWLRWQDEDSLFSIYYDQAYSRTFLPEHEKLDISDLVLLAESIYP